MKPKPRARLETDMETAAFDRALSPQKRSEKGGKVVAGSASNLALSSLPNQRRATSRNPTNRGWRIEKK